MPALGDKSELAKEVGKLPAMLAELDVLQHFERKAERGAQELADLER